MLGRRSGLGCSLPIVGNGFRVEVAGAKANFSLARTLAAVNVHVAPKLHSYRRTFSLLSLL